MTKARPNRKPQRREASRPLVAVFVGLALVIAIAASYGRVSNYPFINFDDDQYVYQNPHVTRGFTASGIAWAFTTFHAGNWHPLTWLSHMLDVELFGLNAGRHHQSNLVLHVANTLLLLFLLVRMTGALWRSALVAGLFALHPLHVESVAWISERKDVLSSFFFLLTIWAYVRHVKDASWKTQLLLAAAFAAGLMSKPMLVTTPFALLLLDYWPLGRLNPVGTRAPAPGHWRRSLLRRVREKTLLFAMAGASGAITLVAQRHGGAIASLDLIPLGSRVINALSAYFTYLQKTVWPSRLAILYPVSGPGASTGTAVLGLLLVVGMSLLAARLCRTRGYFATGWFWYLGMLVPVVGLIQVGSQSMADRYAYLPLIGVFIISAWELGRLADSWERGSRLILAGALSGLLVALGACTFFQVEKWSSSVRLYEWTLDVAPNNPSVLLNLGSEMASQGRLPEAIRYYEQTLALRSDDAQAHAALGTSLAQQGENERATDHLQRALSLDPRLPQAHRSMGVLLLSQSRIPEATTMLREAVRLDPEDADARNSLGAALLMQGQVTEAISEFNTAVRIRPGFTQALNNLEAARTVGSASPAR